MEALPLNMPKFPMLRFVARHGRNLIALISICLLIVGLFLIINMDLLIGGIITLILSLLSYIIGRALVEMVELITDMLLPK